MSDSDSYDLPQDRFYHPRDHTWSQVREADGSQVRIGMDAMQLDNLGELAYIQLQPPGTVVKAGDSIGTLEAAKMTAEIFAPVSGTIELVNDSVLTQPLLVNQQPYGEGWLLQLTPSDWTADSAALIGGADIEAWAVAEEARFKAEFDASA